MSNKIVPITFQGYQVSFNNDGWINATQASRKFGKVPNEWLRLESTKEYIEKLSQRLSLTNTGKSRITLVSTRKGNTNTSGTWIHPKLAIKFARWLSIDFEIWCDEQIEAILKNSKHWKESRRESALGYRAMSDAVLLVRQALGKEVKPHHFMNEAKLINGIMTGIYKGRDRDQLSREELDLVRLLEDRNAFLIAREYTYEQRKKELTAFLAKLTIKLIAA